MIMSGRFRSRWDTNIFIYRVLRRRDGYLLLLSLFALLAGGYFSAVDAWMESGITIALSIANIVRESWSIKKLISPDTEDIISEDSETANICSKLDLPQSYIHAGYEILSVPNDHNECIVRSATVDKILRDNAKNYGLRENQNSLKKINDRLRENANNFELALRLFYRESKVNNREFHNEDKVGFGSDLLCVNDGENNQKISVYRATYFHSLLTNELSKKIIRTSGPYPQYLFRGSEYYFAGKQGNGRYKLPEIDYSLMANHIGVSTLVYTSDNKLTWWWQSEKAQQSRELLAPKGSGSCDWKDWTKGGSLKTLVINAMVREFKEESLPEDKWADLKIRTAILGYYRWIKRGGKPEFVGISRVSAKASDLIPADMEVGHPNGEDLYKDVFTIDDLKNVVKELLEDGGTYKLSIPLWVNLLCLQDALADDSWWETFMALPLEP